MGSKDVLRAEQISFNQLNKQTGHRIKYVKIDADTGEEVPNEDIVKGYALDKEIRHKCPRCGHLSISRQFRNA